MTVTASSFRVSLPEFADTVRFPDALISRWIIIAGKFHNPDRWGDLLDHGVELYTAHRVVLSAMSTEQVAGGGMPGVGMGVVASQGASKVNVSFDTGATNEEGAGHWNMTTYGMQWRELLRLMGAGPLEIDAGSAGTESASAWTGPFAYP